jgi:hypothetical protein
MSFSQDARCTILLTCGIELSTIGSFNTGDLLLKLDVSKRLVIILLQTNTFFSRTSIAANTDVLKPIRGDMAWRYKREEMEPLVDVVRGKDVSMCNDDLRLKWDEFGETGLIMCPRCSWD